MIPMRSAKPNNSHNKYLDSLRVLKRKGRKFMYVDGNVSHHFKPSSLKNTKGHSRPFADKQK
jgi:UDP-2,3-diacylglucosamine pyrophosphatase LpxH